MNFETLAIATSIVTALLAIGWLFAGRLLLKRWRIEATGTDLLIGRRIGAIYLGLSVIFFLARGAPPSELQTSLSIGVLLVCALLAGLGIIEFKCRRAGPAILVSVAVEILLCVGYGMLLWKQSGA